MKSFFYIFLFFFTSTVYGQNEVKHDSTKISYTIKEKFIKSLKYLKLRNGKLNRRKEDIINELVTTLKPLDILVEKSSFLITDKFIPGHFGHVALWLGDENEYIKRNIWNNSLVKKYQDQIKTSDTILKFKKTIVEAVTNGVRLSSIYDFLDADDLVVLRPTCVFENELDDTTAILQALMQVGKEYDFDFDVQNKDKIICSELACICFPKINWEEIRFFGKRTVSPDNIVRTCLKENFEIVTFYHNGKECSPKKRERLIKKLTRYLN